MPRSPRRKADPKDTPTPPEGPGSIFASPADAIVPGEVLVKLTREAARAVTETVPTAPLRATAALAPVTLGVAAVDRVLARHGCAAIARLHPPQPPAPESLLAGTLDAGRLAAAAEPLASTFRVHIDAGADPAAVAEELRGLDEVEDASPNAYVETFAVPNDPSFAQQWGLTKINCPQAWDRTTGSASVVVAVVDTGVDLDHPELAPLLVQGRDLVDLAGFSPPPGFHFEGDISGADDDPQDEVGHGTHVAGTIACASNNNAGVAGVTWNCRIMPVRVLARIVNNNNANDVRGTGSAADVAAGIRWAVDHGARVINLSLGGPVSTMVQADAVAYAVAHDVVVVAAMGNAFNQGNPTSYPAAYPGVVAVGATTQSDTRASFSQTGSHISVSAPGVGVLSTMWDNGFATLQGTSMASPHVAGVAALIRSCNGNLPAAQVGDIIRQTAKPLKDDPADPVPNDRYGWGLVDAAAAVARACPQLPSQQIICRPSLVTLCKTVQVLCRPSHVFRCPSEALVLCRPSRLIRCRSELVALCNPSSLLECPTRIAIICEGISGGVQCFEGPPFERPPFEGPIDGPIRGGVAEAWSWDPYGEDWGEEGQAGSGCC